MGQQHLADGHGFDGVTSRGAFLKCFFCFLGNRDHSHDGNVCGFLQFDDSIKLSNTAIVFPRAIFASLTVSALGGFQSAVSEAFSN